MNTQPIRIDIAAVITGQLDMGISSDDRILELATDAIKMHGSCGLRNDTHDCECYPDELAPCGEMHGTCKLVWPMLPDGDDMVELAENEGWEYLTTDEKPDEPITTKQATAFMDGAKAALGERGELEQLLATRNPYPDGDMHDMWEEGYDSFAGEGEAQS